jgi:HSP20 family protein
MLVKNILIDNSIRDLISRLPKRDAFSVGSKFIGSDYFVPQFPKVDFSESEDSFLIQAELPGFKKEDLEIKYENRILSLSGKRNEETKDAKILHRERFSGKFVRHFSLPNYIQSNKIKSTFSDGILSISILKSESARLKEIKISE